MIRAIFCGITIACLSAVASMFVAAVHDMPSRLFATSMVIAGWCALTFPALPRDDMHRPRVRSVVWFLMVSLQVTIGLLIIWVDLVQPSFVPDEAVGFSIAILPFAFAATFFPLMQLERPRGPHHPAPLIAVGLFGIVTVGTECALLFNAFVLFGGTVTDKLLQSWAVLMWASAVISACVYAIAAGGRQWRVTVAVIGITTTVLAAGVWIELVYSNFTPARPLVPFALTASGIATAIGMLGMGIVVPLNRPARGLVPVFALLTALLGVFLSGAIERTNRMGLYQQLLFGTAVLDGCVGLAIVILFQVGRRSVATNWEVLGAEVNCPRCGKRSTFATGSNPCPQCGFRVVIAFRDERCARCKHDVHLLPAGTPCPECGLAIENSVATYFKSDAGGAEGAKAAAAS